MSTGDSTAWVKGDAGALTIALARHCGELGAKSSKAHCSCGEWSMFVTPGFRWDISHSAHVAAVLVADGWRRDDD